MMVKGLNRTERSTAGDRTLPSAALDGEPGEPLDIPGCPDPNNCTKPEAPLGSGLDDRAAA